MGQQPDELAQDIRRIQQGDAAAFDRIYSQFASPLYRFIYARCGNTAVAEEISGELWLRIVEALPRFRLPPENGGAAFRSWMYRIAANLVIDSLRQLNRTDGFFDEEQPDRSPSPDERAIARDEQRLLQEAFESLTPDQREIVMLRFFEDRSHAEVAALTGRSEGAVKVLQHRALKTLARLLGIERRQSAKPNPTPQATDE